MRKGVEWGRGTGRSGGEAGGIMERRGGEVVVLSE